MQDKKWPY